MAADFILPRCFELWLLEKRLRIGDAAAAGSLDFFGPCGARSTSVDASLASFTLSAGFE